jgi:hypothetical protein
VKPARLLFMSVIAVNACGEFDQPEPDPAAARPSRDQQIAAVAAQIPRRDLGQHPPVVASMQLFPATGADVSTGGPALARLEVRYAEALPPTIDFLDEDTVRTLRDDGRAPDRVRGDGVYSVLLPPSSDLLASDAADDTAGRDWAGELAQLPRDGSRGLQIPLFAPRGSDQHLRSTSFPQFLVDPHRALLISDLSVVNDKDRTKDACLSTKSSDADKKWTFGYLIKQAANGKVSPSKFTTDWLKQWMTPDLDINGDTVEPIGTTDSKRKVAGEILRQWRCVSGADTCCLKMPVDDRQDIVLTSPEWLACEAQAAKKPLLMNKAPFRLLAIVNRVDLRHNRFFKEGTAGELRFVFSVLDLEMRETAGGPCAGLSMVNQAREPNPDPSAVSGLDTIILEYAVDMKKPSDVKGWAKRWFDLGRKTMGSSTYLSTLQGITDTIVKANAGAAKNRPNGSELIRIRTNESIDDCNWQLREFVLDKNAKVPVAATVKQTPHPRYADESCGILDAQDFGDELGSWVGANETDVENETYVLPNLDPLNGGEHLAGGESSHVIAGGFWDVGATIFGLGVSPKARHKFSLNTCTGCHGRETDTQFAHIEPRVSSQAATLSGFLTGIDVIDPVFPETTRTFNDLDRRANEMADLLGLPTASTFSFQPNTRTH